MTDNTPQASMRWVAAVVGAAAVAVVVALIVVIATSGGDDDPTPTPLATQTPTPTATPEGQTPSPTPAPPESAYRLVYREFGQTEDVIWAANPANPEEREELARIPHREGYGIKPSLSPDGKKLAYLSLPDYALSAQSSQAETYIRDLETGDTVKVAENVDLMFAPLWSPDGKLIYVRQLAGPEYLSADVMMTRIIVPEIGMNTPTPTPTPRPSETPVPTQEPAHVILRDSVAHVLNFIPVGFDTNGETLFFVQIQGGTQQGSLLALFQPASFEQNAAIWQMYLAALAEAEAINSADPPPSETVTPQPTPSPVARFVVEMSNQTAFEYDLSDDGQALVYLTQEFGDDGIIVNRTFVADIIQASANPVPIEGLPAGHHLRPLWHPGDGRLTIGILPLDGTPGKVVLVARDGSNLEFLPTGFGFDEPRSWSPDGAWLAVSHSDSDSLTNPRDVRLEVLSPNGFRATVILGVDNATEDSVLGWILPDDGEDE